LANSPRIILIEHTGMLVGLITVKDVLKYIARRDAEEEQQHDVNSAFIDGESDEEDSGAASPTSPQVAWRKRGVSFVELGQRRQSDG
jgi:hypothetical protein